MGNKLVKYLHYSLYAMFAISVILILMVVKDSDDNAKLDGLLNTSFYWSYLLFFIAFIGIVIFTVYQMITVKGDKKKSVVSLVAIIVIFVLAYAMSSSEIPQFYGAKALIAEGTLTPNTVKMVDTGLYATYILAVLSIGALVYTSVSKIWSK